MIRRPPRSTLFPTRRSSDLVQNGTLRKADLSARYACSSRWLGQGMANSLVNNVSASMNGRFQRTVTEADTLRSEEHTSELQSLTNLVCRLLLEKKKKKKRHM